MAKVQGANATTDVGPPLSGFEIDEAARNVQAKMMDEKVAVVKEAILRSVGPPKDSAAAPQLESVPEFEGKIHRVDPAFGSTLTASNRDSQSNCWVNSKIVGQPCEFQVLRPATSTRSHVPSAGASRRSPRRRRSSASQCGDWSASKLHLPQ
jgi:hypothetical protein